MMSVNFVCHSKCYTISKEKFIVYDIYIEGEGSVLLMEQAYFPYMIFKIVETRSGKDFKVKLEELNQKKHVFYKSGFNDFFMVYIGVKEPSELSQAIKDGYDLHIDRAGNEAVEWWIKMHNQVRQKLAEKQEFRHVRHLIRQEYGNDTLVIESESPDFIVVPPKDSAIGVEMTKCTPFPKRMEDADFEYKVIQKFRDNEYLQSVTKERKLNITIYPMRSFYKGGANIDDCCAEIETFVRLWLENNMNSVNFLTHIRKIEVSEMPTSSSNAIDFDHTARREAIRASDILESIRKKEKKLPKFILNDNAWLCIYLPPEENLHPYSIIYDEDCTEDKFNMELGNSHFKRIYLTSFGPRDIMQLKPNAMIDSPISLLP